jgi:uncharacterized membrane protein
MSTTDTLVSDYLRSVERELGGLPRPRRREIVNEIAAHIAEARAHAAADDEAAARNVLEQLGDPADIAAEAGARPAAAPRTRWHEVSALILLSAGSIVLPVVGWFAGVVLLWTSYVWTTRDKLIGTLVVPGGLGLSLALLVFGIAATSESCSGGIGPSGTPLTETCTGGPTAIHQILVAGGITLLVVAPIAATIYLAQRLRRAQAVTV